MGSAILALPSSRSGFPQKASIPRIHHPSLLILILILISSLPSEPPILPTKSLVIYNSRVPDSQKVADHYATTASHVPAASQVLGLNLPTGENMTRDEYRDQLQLPLLQFLEKEKLFTFTPGGRAPGLRPACATCDEGPHIVTPSSASGVPLRILDDPLMAEPGAEKFPLELRDRNGAAVDSELTLLPWSRQKLGLDRAKLNNPVYAFTNAALLNPIHGILIVTRLDGPDAAIAMSLVDKAIEAETNGLWGRAYFDARGITNGPHLKGDVWDARRAADTARRFGFATVLDDRPETFSAAFPMSQIALYAGFWYAIRRPPARHLAPRRDSIAGPAHSGGYHLHSFSAHTLRLRPPGYWCGPLLARSAPLLPPWAALMNPTSTAIPT